MAFFISRLARKKFIYDERGLMAEEYADGGMWKRDGLLYRTVRYIEKRLLTGADSVIVLTQNIKKFLIEGNYLPKGRRLPPVDVIACCADLGKFFYRPGYKADARQAVAPALRDRFVFI
jgi:glycosyltransferase involved in cell wall biosynthesis